MKILFDQGTPVPLRAVLGDHVVETAYEREWATLDNGELLAAAERSGFDVLVTTDRNLAYQQDLTKRKLAILTLPTTRWPQIREHASEIVAALSTLEPGDYREVRW